MESIGSLKEKTGKTSNAIFPTNLALRTQDISSFYSERVALQETKCIFTFKTYHWAKNRRAKKRVLVIAWRVLFVCDFPNTGNFHVYNSVNMVTARVLGSRESAGSFH